METNIYETKSVNKLIWVFAIPSIISLIVEMMTTVVDTVFAGHLGNISENALSSMGLISPIISIFISFQSLYAMSTSIFIAKYFNDKEKRQKYFLVGTIFSFLISSIISIITYFFIDNILYFLGATGVIFDLSKQYLLIQLISNIFSSLGYTFTSAIRSFGFPKVEMIITILSVVLNIIFNAFFIFKLKLGIKALAFSTLISEFFCFTISLIYILKCKFLSRQHKLVKKDLLKSIELFKLGIAQTLIQVFGGSSGFFINDSIILNLGDTYLAVWNIVQKIYLIALMPIVGITQGIRSMISYYSSNNQIQKKKKTINLTLIHSFSYGIISTIFIIIFAKNIILIFGDISEISNITVKALKIVISSLCFLGIVYTIMTLFEVTGYEKSALILILFRQVFIIIPLVYLLPIFIKSEISVFLSIPIADILSILFTYILIKIKGL